MITFLFHYCHPEGLTSAFVSHFALFILGERSETERVSHVAGGLVYENTEHHFFLHAALFSVPLSSSLSPLCSLRLCFLFLSVRSGPVAVFSAGTVIMCFDTVGSPAVFFSVSQNPPESSQQPSTNTVIENFKVPPRLVLAVSGPARMF